MDAIIERCAGLDVHQATVVACVLIGEAGRKPLKEIRTFSTMTQDLEAMRDWLKGHGVTHHGGAERAAERRSASHAEQQRQDLRGDGPCRQGCGPEHR